MGISSCRKRMRNCRYSFTYFALAMAHSIESRVGSVATSLVLLGCKRKVSLCFVSDPGSFIGFATASLLAEITINEGEEGQVRNY